MEGTYMEIIWKFILTPAAIRDQKLIALQLVSQKKTICTIPLIL